LQVLTPEEDPNKYCRKPVKHASGEADHFGSGVLLQVEGTRFLVTAAHVSDEFFCERWRQILFGTPNEDDLIP
jgi:hypothetical protein